MPIASGFVPPEEPKFPTLPAEVYSVEVEDIEFETKPNPFKLAGDEQPDTLSQYKVAFKILTPVKFKDKKLTTWINSTLRTSTKAKRPGLPSFLRAVTGEEFGVADRAKLTGDFLNTLIGMKLRVTTQVEKKGESERTVITTYLSPE